MYLRNLHSVTVSSILHSPTTEPGREGWERLVALLCQPSKLEDLSTVEGFPLMPNRQASAPIAERRISCSTPIAKPSILPTGRLQIASIGDSRRSACTASQPKALVACCECGNRQVLARLVDQSGLKPVIATSTGEAVATLGSEAVLVAFCQDDLAGDGFEPVLKAAKRAAVPLVVSSRLADPKRYLESMNLGAFDFICAPYYNPEVAALARAMLQSSAPNPEDSARRT